MHAIQAAYRAVMAMDTLSSMNNLAGTLHAQDDLAGALELGKSVLAARRRVLGETHPGNVGSR